jgi:hypothetical protein
VEAPELHRRLREALKGQTFADIELIESVLVDALPPDQDKSVRIKAAQLLAEFGPPRSFQSILALLRAEEDQDEEIRGAVRDWLLACCSDESRGWAAPMLHRAMEDARPECRRAAVRAWKRLGLDLASVAVPALVRALGDEERFVRLETLSTLGWLGSEAEAAVPAVLDVLLGEQDAILREAAVRTLLMVDPEHQRSLPRLAEIEGDNSREALLKILRSAGPEARALRRALTARWAAREASETPQESRHPDGPELPAAFWWGGTRYDISPIPCKLLHYMWDRDQAPIEEVARHVWGEWPCTPGRIKSALRAANHTLEEANAERAYGQKKGFIARS